jgi:hypothetical protein
VPMSPVGPKHLFHFIIRYEGEGIIDANVAKFAKALSQEAVSNHSGYSFPPTVCQSPDPLQRTNGTNGFPIPAPSMPPADAPKSMPAPSGWRVP